jgi:hypothetical protein
MYVIDVFIFRDRCRTQYGIAETYIESKNRRPILARVRYRISDFRLTAAGFRLSVGYADD